MKLKKLFFAILPLIPVYCLLILGEQKRGLGLEGIGYNTGLYALPITYLIYLGCLIMYKPKPLGYGIASTISTLLLIFNIFSVYKYSQLKPSYHTESKAYNQSKKHFDAWLSEMKVPKPPTVYKGLMDKLFYSEGFSRITERFFSNPQNFDKALFQETIRSFKIFPLKEGYLISNQVTAANAKKMSYFVALYNTKDELLDHYVYTSRFDNEFLYDASSVEDWDNDGSLDLITHWQINSDTLRLDFNTTVYDIQNNRIDMQGKFSMIDSSVVKSISNIPYVSQHTKSIAQFENDSLIKIETTEWLTINEALKQALINKDNSSDFVQNMLKTEEIFRKSNQFTPTKRVDYCKKSVLRSKKFDCPQN